VIDTENSLSNSRGINTAKSQLFENRPNGQLFMKSLHTYGDWERVYVIACVDLST
jgi:hypothetical protein